MLSLLALTGLFLVAQAKLSQDKELEELEDSDKELKELEELEDSDTDLKELEELEDSDRFGRYGNLRGIVGRILLQRKGLMKARAQQAQAAFLAAQQAQAAKKDLEDSDRYAN